MQEVKSTQKVAELKSGVHKTLANNLLLNRAELNKNTTRLKSQKQRYTNQKKTLIHVCFQKQYI